MPKMPEVILYLGTIEASAAELIAAVRTEGAEGTIARKRANV